MNNNICNNPHREDAKFSILPESQANAEGRHKCAACAYDQGHADGLAGVEPSFRPDELPFSQAGEVRHKSAFAGYTMGYADGMHTRAGNAYPIQPHDPHAGSRNRMQ